jgi:hypothetical protein
VKGLHRHVQVLHFVQDDKLRSDDRMGAPTALPAVPFRTSPSIAMPFDPAISEGLSLASLQPTASPALASELIAYRLQQLAAYTGNCTVNRDPAPTSLSIVNRHPMDSASRRAIGNPSPAPSCARRSLTSACVNGSKMDA